MPLNKETKPKLLLSVLRLTTPSLSLTSSSIGVSPLQMESPSYDT